MTNKVIDSKFSAIIDALSYWLGYQNKIGRQHLIHEASLRYPIADSITSKDTSINRVVLEKVHPIFKSKRFDMVIYNKDVVKPTAEKDDSRLEEAYEFKIANSDTNKFESDEHQRVFDDVVRLAYYNMWNKKNCYFLMCGKYDDFKAFFIGQATHIKAQGNKNIVVPGNTNKKASLPIQASKWNANGLYKDWFGFQINEEKKMKFKIADPLNKAEWGLRSFQDRYEIRKELKLKLGFDSSITIKTTCLAITPNGLEKSRTHAVGIWKIETV